MSYDLNIWSCQRVEADQKEIKIGEYTISIDESVVVEPEDVPVDALLSLSEIKYLTSLHLQPYTEEKTVVDKAIRYSKKLAKEFNGVVENPQHENEVLLTQKRKTFTQKTRDADIISICWYMDSQQSLSNHLEGFVDLLEKYLPHALPRRYGSFEPPEFKYSETGRVHLIKFLNDEHFPVIYCTKPITYIFLSDAYVDNKKFKIKEYRCNKIEIQMLKEAYLEQNWQFAVKRLFKEVAKLFKPFYAEIVDEKENMVCSWWWKGIPAKRGNPIIIGEPYSVLLGNLPKENELETGLYYFENDIQEIKIPRKFVSNKKLLARKRQELGFFADNFNYAKEFPLNFPKAVHNMKLHSSPFEMIKSGQKTIELRLYDEKRRQIKVGDNIVFTNTVTGETLTATVIKLHVFDSFSELYKNLPLLKCGYTNDDITAASPLDMLEYYSREEEKKHGVVGIELSV